MKMAAKFLCALLLALPLAAQAAQAIQVTDGWVRAMPPVAKNSAGYLLIDNRGAEADVLLGATVEGARVTEIHEMVRSGESLVMRRRSEIAVAAGGSVALAPGGLHLMLIDLQRPLLPGETRQAVLRFRQAGEVPVVLTVRGQ